tara:strand:- start:50 stop:289 length:240 start_codon:yes stop_codon:yes gene_type:complete
MAYGHSTPYVCEEFAQRTLSALLMASMPFSKPAPQLAYLFSDSREMDARKAALQQLSTLGTLTRNVESQKEKQMYLFAV